MKNSIFEIMVVFSPIFVVDTKIIFVYNFVVPLINLPKELFIIKVSSFTRNRPCHILKLKANSLGDSVTESLTVIYSKGLKFTKIRLRQSLELKTDNSITDSFTAIYRKDMKLYQKQTPLQPKA